MAAPNTIGPSSFGRPFPAGGGETGALIRSDRSATSPVQAAGEAMLVVEDGPVMRGLVLDGLEELGYHGLEAADGPSGLRILESSARIDLLEHRT